MKGLFLVVFLPLMACDKPAPVALSGLAPGASTTAAPKPKPPSPVVPLSGKATAAGGMK